MDIFSLGCVGDPRPTLSWHMVELNQQTPLQFGKLSGELGGAKTKDNKKLLIARCIATSNKISGELWGPRIGARLAYQRCLSTSGFLRGWVA